MPPRRRSPLLPVGLVVLFVLGLSLGAAYVGHVGPFADTSPSSTLGQQPATVNPNPTGMESGGAAGRTPGPTGSPVPLPASPLAGPNPIVVENQLPGSTDWVLNGPISSDTINQIKGYADQVSVNRGGTINFKVTVDTPQQFTIAIYRLGWYGGLGGRLMSSIGPLSGITQPACPTDPVTRMVSCAWSTSYTLAVPAGWVSGAYLAKLQSAHGYQNYVSFFVRDDSGRSAILVQSSTNTWEAYNPWGGTSLYPSGLTHAVRVTFDRPYHGTGTELTTTELQFIRFVEREGFDVTYQTDVDTHERGQLLLNHRAFVSMGHDEYWTWQMRDAVEGARDRGVNLGFFGGNDSYWQVRYEPSASGKPDRFVVGYKEEFRHDPYYTSGAPQQLRNLTAQWRYPLINRPEQLMMGLMYGYNLGPGGDLPFTVNNANSWVWAGTGVYNGEQLTQIVGREYDDVHTGVALPANTSFVVLGQTTDPANGTLANTVLYQAPSGALVFAAGTMDWSWGLDDLGGHHRVSPAIQRATINILSRFSGTPTSGG